MGATKKNADVSIVQDASLPMPVLTLNHTKSVGITSRDLHKELGEVNKCAHQCYLGKKSPI